MSLRIEWSPQALLEFENLLTYLQIYWGNKSMKKFYDEFQSALNTICLNPDLFPPSKELPEFRKFVMRKQVSILYRVKGESIELVSICDNRQNPDNLTII